MIKPFEIKMTRQEPGGTGVIYSVSRREISDAVETVKTIESYVLVPSGQDVDSFVFDHLKASGWIQ